LLAPRRETLASRQLDKALDDARKLPTS